MSVDRKAREEIRQALVRYMAGESKAFEFDDRIARFRWAKSTEDGSVRQICDFLWRWYDDLVDHPISVTQEGWLAFRRTIAFLNTDLEIQTKSEKDVWPFLDQEEWLRHEHFLKEVALPQFDPAIHSRPANPWWDRPISTSVGVGILLGLLLCVFVLLLRS
jgi:hypothetical protein